MCCSCPEIIFVFQALAEKESDGMAKMIYRKDTGDILGVHIFGLHAADLIHEASNAIATGQRVQVSCSVRSHMCSVPLIWSVLQTVLAMCMSCTVWHIHVSVAASSAEAVH